MKELVKDLTYGMFRTIHPRDREALTKKDIAKLRFGEVVVVLPFFVVVLAASPMWLPLYLSGKALKAVFR